MEVNPAEVAYRELAPVDEPAVNEGFNRVFGARRSLEEWRWKYQEAPEGRWMMVAEDASGTLLAVYGAVPVRVRVDGVAVRAGQIVDVYSLPEVRRTKVFTTCYETFIRRWGNPDDLPLMFGFPGGIHYEMGLKQLLYVLLGPVPYWRRETPRVVLPRPLSGRVVEGFDEVAAGALWARAADRYPVAAVRDPAWLRRRYTGRPGVEYLHLTVHRGGVPRAWGVARAMAPAFRWADLVWDGAETADLAALDRAMARAARRRGCAHEELWLGGDEAAERALRQRGWTRAAHPEDLHMVMRTFHPGVDPERLRTRLYLTMGDSDLV